MTEGEPLVRISHLFLAGCKKTANIRVSAPDRTDLAQGGGQMGNLSLLSLAFIACTFNATTAFGLIIPFGQQEIADAGTGCVAGYTSDHASGAYFRGATALLNQHLEKLAKEDRHQRSVKVILHAGAFKIDDPEETLITDAKKVPAQLAVDWSVRRLCPAENVLAGTCRGAQREIVVDIWVANEIKLDALRVPAVFKVESAAEIEQFVKRHAHHE
jgi:hypothetical protein